MINKNANLDDALKYLRSNHIDNALKIFHKILKFDSKNLNILTHISNIYRTKKNIHKYNFYLRKISIIDKESYKTLNNLALTYKELGNYTLAEKYFLKSLKINQKYILVNFNLGLLYEEKGDFEKAKKYYSDVINLDDKFMPAYYNLQRIDKEAISEKSYSVVKKILNEENKKISKDTSYGYFLLANKVEKNDTSQEIKYLKKGHDIFFNSDHSNKYTCNLWLNLIPNMMKKKIHYSEYTSNKIKKKLEPILIFGLPRSGTTLVETIISSGRTKVPNIGEASIIHNTLINLAKKKQFREDTNSITINFKNLHEKINYAYQEHEILKNYTGVKFIDRAMENFFFYEIIFKIFPNVRIVHCNRNYFHNTIAIYKQCLENLPWTHKIEDIIKYIILFDKVISQIKNKYPNNILSVDLKDLTNEPEKISKLIFGFCDLEWSKDVLNFYERKDLISSTASNIQIRNKIYKYDFNKFKKYEKYFSKYFTKNNLLEI